MDKLIGGLHPNELIVLAARPSVGKTGLALNIADNVSVKDKQTVFLVSLEMTKIELTMRLTGSHAKLNIQKIRGNALSEEECHHFAVAADELAKSPMYIDDTPKQTVAEIKAVARHIKQEHDLKLIIIDYLGLITPENPNDPRQEQIATIIRRLKVLAKELQVPVLCLAQLNRQMGNNDNERPRLSQLRESGSIEQDADVVILIHREEGATNAELIVAKQRNGATGNAMLTWTSEFARFDNM